MTKKKKILNGVIFLVGLIVFAIYYFKDNTDLAKVEKKQDDSAKKSAEDPETGLDAIGADLKAYEAEQDSKAKVAAENPETGLDAIDADLKAY